MVYHGIPINDDPTHDDAMVHEEEPNACSTDIDSIHWALPKNPLQTQISGCVNSASQLQ